MSVSAGASQELYVGLMSGTSLDGADAVLVDFSSSPLQTLGHHYRPYPNDLRRRLEELAMSPSVDVVMLGQTHIELAHFYAKLVEELLAQSGQQPGAIQAVGCHGQTIRHAPGATPPFSLQIGDASTLAELCGITTVAQFRQRDMAAGGQGAPLVPPFHRFLFHSPEENRVVLNLGGIANITWLPADDGQLLGFDTGPANLLLDAWCQKQLNLPFDEEGRHARDGKLIEPLLREMQGHPFFGKAPPKSTGREDFHLVWLEEILSHLEVSLRQEDVLRTLAELTAWSVADAIGRLLESEQTSAPGTLIACGGGARNDFLLERLASYLPNTRVVRSDSFGIDPQHIEAMAFAWLARQAMLGQAGNHPAVTGAAGFRVLGGIYPA